MPSAHGHTLTHARHTRKGALATGTLATGTRQSGVSLGHRESGKRFEKRPTAMWLQVGRSPRRGPGAEADGSPTEGGGGETVTSLPAVFRNDDASVKRLMTVINVQARLCMESTSNGLQVIRVKISPF
ncbi:unnamed protein product [Lampetra planeri]